MGWVKTKEELDRYYRFKIREFNDAEMLGAMFTVKAESAAALLPPPLKPPDQPTGLIFIARYPKTNLGPGYLEAGLFLSCNYQGENGSYCLSMPIESEPDRLHNGRDIYGFPKKAASIHLEKNGGQAVGRVERFGITFVEVKATLTGTLPELPATGPNFLFKALPAADLSPGFDGPVFLVRQDTELNLKSLEVGEGQVLFQDSPYDPWSEIGLEQVLAAFYLVSDNKMNPGRVVAEVDPEAYLPYSFKGLDFFTG